MSTTMRAKMTVHSVDPVEGATNYQRLTFGAVTTKPYDENGDSEDNTFARYTPAASLEMSITNPNLVGKFKAGDTFYVDFTPVE